jgi:hypothetical protein
MAALVGAQPITAPRGVNPFSMLQLRCATFAVCSRRSRMHWRALLGGKETR